MSFYFLQGLAGTIHRISWWLTLCPPKIPARHRAPTLLERHHKRGLYWRRVSVVEHARRAQMNSDSMGNV